MLEGGRILLRGQVRQGLKFSVGFNDMEGIDVTFELLLPWSPVQKPDCNLQVVRSERAVRK